MATGNLYFNAFTHPDQRAQFFYSYYGDGKVHFSVKNIDMPIDYYSTQFRVELQRWQNGGWVVESWYWFDYGYGYGTEFHRTFYNSWANYKYRMVLRNNKDRSHIYVTTSTFVHST